VAINEWVNMPFAEWEIQDENGVGTGAYYSPRTLSQTLGGELLELDKSGAKRIDDRFVVMRYGFDSDTIPEVTAYLQQSRGLTHIRDTGVVNDVGVSKLLHTEDIDYTLFDGTEFMILTDYLLQYVPKSAIESNLNN